MALIAADAACASVRSLESNNLGSVGAKHLSEGLAQNKALTSLKYAAPCSLPFC